MSVSEDIVQDDPQLQRLLDALPLRVRQSYTWLIRPEGEMGAMAAWPRTYPRRGVRFPAGPWLLDGAAWGAADRRGYSTDTARYAPPTRPTLSLVGRAAFAAAITIGWP